MALDATGRPPRGPTGRSRASRSGSACCRGAARRARRATPVCASRARGACPTAARARSAARCRTRHRRAACRRGWCRSGSAGWGSDRSRARACHGSRGSRDAAPSGSSFSARCRATPSVAPIQLGRLDQPLGAIDRVGRQAHEQYEVSSRFSQRCTVGCGSATSRPSSVWLTSCPMRRQAARISRRKSGSEPIAARSCRSRSSRCARSRRTRPRDPRASSVPTPASGSRRAERARASLPAASGCAASEIEPLRSPACASNSSHNPARPEPRSPVARAVGANPPRRIGPSMTLHGPACRRRST